MQFGSCRQGDDLDRIDRRGFNLIEVLKNGLDVVVLYPFCYVANGRSENDRRSRADGDVAGRP